MAVASKRGLCLDFLVAVRINVGSYAASSLVRRRSLPALVSFRRRHRLEHVPLRPKTCMDEGRIYQVYIYCPLRACREGVLSDGQGGVS